MQTIEYYANTEWLCHSEWAVLRGWIALHNLPRKYQHGVVRAHQKLRWNTEPLIHLAWQMIEAAERIFQFWFSLEFKYMSISVEWHINSTSAFLIASQKRYIITIKAASHWMQVMRC